MRRLYLNDKDETVEFQGYPTPPRMHQDIAKRFYQHDISFLESTGEVSKSAVRGTFGLLGSLGVLTSWLGDDLQHEPLKQIAGNIGRGAQEDISPLLNFNTGGFTTVGERWFRTDPKKVKNSEFINKIGLSLVDNGNAWFKKFQQLQHSTKIFGVDIAKADPRIFQGSFMENPSWTRGISAVTAAVPSLFTAAAISGWTKNPVAGAVLLGGSEGAVQRQEAIEAGKSRKQANVIGTLSTIGTTILEAIALDKLMNFGFARKLRNMPREKIAETIKGLVHEKQIMEAIRQIGKGATVEGIQEGTQTLFQNAIARYGYEPTRKLTEGLIESIIGGAGSGGILGAIVPGNAQHIDTAIEEYKAHGATDREIRMLYNDIVGMILDKADIVDEKIKDRIYKDISRGTPTENIFESIKDIRSVVASNKEVSIPALMQYLPSKQKERARFTAITEPWFAMRNLAEHRSTVNTARLQSRIAEALGKKKSKFAQALRLGYNYDKDVQEWDAAIGVAVDLKRDPSVLQKIIANRTDGTPVTVYDALSDEQKRIADKAQLLLEEEVEPTDKTNIVIKKAWHTPDLSFIKKFLRAKYSYYSRSYGKYYALDAPFTKEGGTAGQETVNYNPEKIYDPDSILKGTNKTKSKQDAVYLEQTVAAYKSKITLEITKIIQYETISEKVARFRTEKLQELGYDGEVGIIPEGLEPNKEGHRELILFYPKTKQKQIATSKEIQDLKKIMDDIQQGLTRLGTSAKEAKVGIKNLRRNYFPRKYIFKPAGGSYAARNTAFTKHSKEAKFNTLVEAWAFGYTSRYLGATTALQAYTAELNIVKADKLFASRIKTMRTMSGEQFARPTKEDGFAKLNAPLFEGMYVPKEYASVINNMFDESKLKGIGIIDTITKYNALFKAIRLTSSVFHHVAFFNSYFYGVQGKANRALKLWRQGKIKEGAKAWNEDVNPFRAYQLGYDMIYSSAALMEHGIKNGLTFGRIQDWNESIVRERNAISKLLNKWGASKQVKDTLGKFREDYTHYLFNVWGAGLKAKSFAIEYAHHLQRNPGIDENQAAREVADLVNDDFGGLHLRRMGRNPTVQHLNRLLWLGADWTESNIRTMYKVFGPGTTSKSHQELYRRFWTGVFMKGAMVTILGNMMMAIAQRDDDDKDEFENLLSNYVDAWESGKLNLLRVYLNPMVELFGGTPHDDYYLNPIGHFLDPVKWFTRDIKKGDDILGATGQLVDPTRLFTGLAKSVYYKSSMATKPIYDFLKGTDYTFWRKFKTLDELMTGKNLTADDKALLVRWKKWNEHVKLGIEPNQYLSFTLYQLAQLVPVPIQTLWYSIFGEAEAIETLPRLFGLDVRPAYNKKKRSKK